jgi:hypothetical protein
MVPKKSKHFGGDNTIIIEIIKKCNGFEWTAQKKIETVQKMMTAKKKMNDEMIAKNNDMIAKNNDMIAEMEAVDNKLKESNLKESNKEIVLKNSIEYISLSKINEI